MATLYKHGEILQIDKLDHRIAFCADGKILRNDGEGWKTYKKLKPGLDASTIAHKLKLSTRPAFSSWRELLHENFPLALRGLAVRIIGMMPDDPDGCWSEINDYSSLTGNGELVSIDDCVALCRAYKWATDEAKEFEAAKTQEPAIA
jgi:hypothetical protein